MAKTIATVLGALFVLLGLIGFVAPNLLGAHLSTTHNIIHLVSGAVSLYFGLAGSISAARMFCFVFGAVYLLLGVVGFIGGTGDDRMLHVLPGALELGTPDHVIHILLGLIYLVAGLMTGADDRAPATAA